MIIFVFSGAHCLHCVIWKAQDLPDKNVTLLIRKEQQIMSNDDLMVIFVLTGQATFLYCDTCHLQMVLLIAI